MNQFWRIAPHTQPIDDEDEAAEVREAIAEAVIARAQQVEGTLTPSDEVVDSELSRLDHRIAAAQTPSELREALRRIASEASYTVEELDEELNR